MSTGAAAAAAAAAAGGGGGAPPPAGNGGGQPPGGGAGTNWFGAAAPDLQTYIQNKGWTDPMKVVESYQSLETVFGADKAGRPYAFIPKDDAKPEELNEFFKKIGRPDTAKEYDWGDAIKEGEDPKLLDSVSEAFHAAGLTGKQARALNKWRTDTAKAMKEAQDAAFLQQSTLEETALKKEFGSAWAQKEEIARRGFKLSGLSPAQIDLVERAIGTDKTYRMFIMFGEQSLEARAPAGDTESGGAKDNFNAALSPAQAQQRVNALMADANFMAKYNSPNLAVRNVAIKQMEDLNKIVVSGG